MRKVPFIFQFNSTECGACVIAMILHYYGAYYTLQEIREQMPVTRDGTTIKMLIDTFSYYGIEASVYHATRFDLLEYEFPMIINWTENHYVILEKITEKYVWIVYSGIGRLKISHKEFDSKYSGIVILLKKVINLKRKKEK